MNLLNHSVRIAQDLDRALEKGTAGDVQIIVREWVDLPIEAELRGFVCGGKLTALTQYVSFTF
jgi:hypothetical protein